MAPRLAGLEGPPEFTGLPHFESLQVLNRAYLELFRDGSARPETLAILEQHSDNRIVKKALRRVFRAK